MPIWHNESRPPERAGFSLHRAWGESKGPFSFAKENGPFGTPRERLCLAVSGLNYFDASGMQLPARGEAAFSIAIRFASAPIIRCCAAVGGSAALRMRHTPCGYRSAHLAEVRSNQPEHYSMRRAPAMPLFRKQSAAGQTSLAPHDSKARLISVTTCRRFMAKPCTPQCNPQAEQFFKCLTANVRGQGAGPLAFSWGFKGAILSRERMAPFPAFPAPRRESHCCLQAARICKALLL